MDTCPNCGEPLEENAAICPFCGSDEETGWREDADYYSVELPESDFSYEEPPARSTLQIREDWPGFGLMLLALAFLFWAGFGTYGWGALFPVLFLGICALVCRLGTRGSKAEG